MGNELAKALKRKTDAQFRVNGEDYTPSIVERADGVVVYNAPAETMIPYVAGKNVNIGTSGSSKVISAIMNILAGANISVSSPDENGAVTVTGTISGKGINISDFAGKNGYVLTYNSTSDKFELALAAGSYTLPQASETTLGGVKAKAKTTEVVEIAIDPDGKLFSPASPPPAFYSEGEYLTEDFEDLEFVAPYTTSTWSITTADKKTGLRSIVSSKAYDQNYEIRFNIDVGFPGVLSFWYKANKENGDRSYYTFKLDGVTLINSMAVRPWTYFECPIAAGQHELYVRGSNLSNWWSQVFIDDISFPGSRQYFHGIEDHSNMPSIFDNPGKLLKASDDGSTLEFIPKSTFMSNLQGTALPAPSVTYRGQIFTVTGGTGVADLAYVCLKNTTDTYVWTAI